MRIEEAELSDIESVISLIEDVSKSDILPLFSEEGRKTFSSRVLPDVETVINRVNYKSFKLNIDEKLVGFGAIRDGEYITHLFVKKSSQGIGAGKMLLNHLLETSTSTHISLKASINSVSFYKYQGFEVTDVESQTGGIRFIPMCWKRT